MSIDSASTLMGEAAQVIPQLLQARHDSLVEATAVTRNDFVTLIEDDLMGLDWLPDIQQSALRTVSGYMLSAITLLVDVPDINIRRTLGQVNTSRNATDSAILGAKIVSGIVGQEEFVSVESYQYGLPHLDAVSEFDFVDAYNRVKGIGGVGMEDDKSDRVSVGTGRDAIKRLNDVANLATGKVLDVVFERNGNKATVNITINLAGTVTDRDSFLKILTSGVKLGFSQRLRDWMRRNPDKSKLGAIKDLVLTQDLIEESRRLRIKDKSGFYDHMMRNQSKNFKSGLFSLSPSINTASAVLIISDAMAREVELRLGGPLSNPRIRAKLFEPTLSMLLYVVDTQWETVTIYHRSIDAFTEVSKRELQRKTGGESGGDVKDIIEAFQAGNAPSY